MSYTFKNTERNNEKCSEYETKSLLYLLGMRKDSNEIEYITVDCFNDVTGANESFSKLWDIQSKNHKSLPPSKIGESLFTLYDNFISSVNFFDYILFIPKLKREYLIDEKLHIYNYSNINLKTKRGIEQKLQNEIRRVNKIQEETPPLFENFLNSITFVEDNKEISTYIKKITRFNNKKIFSNEFYESIFNDIRNMQTVLKNSYIEKEIISHPYEVLKFKRHITKKEVNTLLISRFIGVDMFSHKSIPIPFFTVIKEMEQNDIQDFILDCKSNLTRAFFNKSCNYNFWKISEFIIDIVKSRDYINIIDVYDKLHSEIIIKSSYLTKETILYMIALVIEGIEDDS